MENIEFLNIDELNENIEKLSKSEEKDEKVTRFTYLSTSMSLNKEDKEEKCPYQLGNTVINDIF